MDNMKYLFHLKIVIIEDIMFLIKDNIIGKLN